MCRNNHIPRNCSFVFVYMHAFICAYIFMCAFICVNMYTCVFTCLYTCVYMYMCMFTCSYVCVYTCMCDFTHTSLYLPNSRKQESATNNILQRGFLLSTCQTTRYPSNGPPRLTTISSPADTATAATSSRCTQ